MRKKKFKWWKLFLILATFFIIVSGLLFLNFAYKVRNISFNYFDEGVENADIGDYLNQRIRQEGSTVFGYIMLNDTYLSKIAHEEYPVVEEVNVAKNLNLDLEVTVQKNDKFFSTCVDYEEFLVKCSYGNSQGVFYEEILKTDDKIVEIKVDREVIYDSKGEKRVNEPDTLSLYRIYTKAEFANLRELINYFKQSYDVKLVEVKDFKIAKIHLNDFYVEVSLDRPYSDIISDFELISRVGELKDYLNDKPKEITYINLYFKNKIFYKLGGGEDFEIEDIDANIGTTSSATSTSF